MKIAQLTPGSGGSFYCENCLRDVALVKAMQQLGHEVLMMPLYLPLALDQVEQCRPTRVFFGGINVYLQQKFSLFRRTPLWIDRLFDQTGLLTWAGKRVGMTGARDLGEMMLSMLQGEEGRQAKELHKLIDWLEQPQNKPDLLCLSNVLLLGLAGQIKERLRIPVVCLLQDEDGFLDDLIPPYRDQAWQILAEKAQDVTTFVAVSRYYADHMERRLGLATGSIHVARAGINVDAFEVRSDAPDAPTIGFLSQLCPPKGADLLLEAFALLKQDPPFAQARLRLAGGRSVEDKAYVRKLQQRIAALGLSADVEFLTEFNQQDRARFLQTLSVMSVPERRPVAYGLYVLEAWAAGVPVVQPDTGVFSELLAQIQGGVLYQEQTPAALADALKPLLADPERAAQLGRQGRKGVVARFDSGDTTRELLDLYEEIVQTHRVAG